MKIILHLLSTCSLYTLIQALYLLKLTFPLKNSENKKKQSTEGTRKVHCTSVHSYCTVLYHRGQRGEKVLFRSAFQPHYQPQANYIFKHRGNLAVKRKSKSNSKCKAPTVICNYIQKSSQTTHLRLQISLKLLTSIQMS